MLYIVIDRDGRRYMRCDGASAELTVRLSIEQFDSLLEAQVLVAEWRAEYISYRPHSALGMLTPTEFAERWRTNQPQLT